MQIPGINIKVEIISKARNILPPMKEDLCTEVYTPGTNLNKRESPEITNTTTRIVSPIVINVCLANSIYIVSLKVFVIYLEPSNIVLLQVLGLDVLLIFRTGHSKVAKTIT
ncbi:ORF-48 [Teiidae poxvirus 1]|nr:ORF-48 [Teiidae poxvirus 1]